MLGKKKLTSVVNNSVTELKKERSATLFQIKNKEDINICEAPTCSPFL